MTLRTILYGSAAAAVLAVASPMVSPIDLSPVAPVQAAASVSFSVFYDDLAPYGDWVSYHDGYVFVPADTGPDWRPYTVGRWVYTDDYGWTWVSEEEHGWATHHYGRWARADDIGWYWVPGSRWAPAWVSWRRSNDYVVWAPLPPDGDDSDLAINISIGAIPDYYWVAVPTRSFLDINLSLVLIDDDDDDRRRIVREARNEDRVRARNDRMMNIAFDPDYIEKRTGKKVERREVRRSERRGRENVNDDSVTVFNDEVRPERDRKPDKVKQVKEVRRSGKAAQGDRRAAEGQPEEQGVPANRRKQKAAQGDEPPQGGKQVRADRRKKPPQQAKQGDEQPEGKPVKQRRKKPIVVEKGDDTRAGKKARTVQQQRRAKPVRQVNEQRAKKPAVERRRQAAEKPVQRKKEAPAQRRKARACDPSVNKNCPAQ